MSDNELAIGQVQWHCSEEGGGPDVGILLRLSEIEHLWLGEMLRDEGDGTGIVIYGPDGKREPLELAYDELRQVFEEHVAPALRAARSVEQLEAENADLRQSVIAFGAPWAVAYAKDFGLAPGELHPTHYDILAKAGARMEAFARAALAEVQEVPDTADPSERPELKDLE